MEKNVLTKDLLKGTLLDPDVKKGTIESRLVKVTIIRREGGWLPPEHEAAVMVGGAKRVFCTPGNALTGQLENPLEGLDKTQLETLAKAVGLENGGSFNIHLKKKDNYWHRFEVLLSRNGDTLDLGRPIEFIKWCVLRSDTDKIAPTWDDKFQKGTYQYALVEEDEASRGKIDKADKMKESWKLYGRLETSESKMRDFLFVYYLEFRDAKKPPKQASPQWLKENIIDIIENKTDRFLKLAQDPQYEIKLLVKKAVDVGVITIENKKYSVPDNEEPIGNLTELINYLDDDRNQQERLRIIALIDKEED